MGRQDIRTSITLPPPLHEEMRKIIKKSKRSMNAEIEKALELYVDIYNEKKFVSEEKLEREKNGEVNPVLKQAILEVMQEMGYEKKESE